MRTGLKPQNGLFQQSAHCGCASRSDAAAIERTVGCFATSPIAIVFDRAELEDRISRGRR